MLYSLVRPIAKLTFKVFFKHIYTNGFEKIPVDGPVLIPSNHPTAFIEPCLAACFQHRTLNFIVRGDIFKKPFYIKLLKSMHLIPIFRFRDGYANLKNNQETFKYCNEVLRDQKAIFILVEGRTIQEKRLRPLQKGTARMAFGAYEEYGVDNTVIVPMGVSYEKANEWRHDVILACAEPLYLKDYLNLYNENPNQAIQQLTDDIALSLPQKMVIIPDKEDDEVSELLCLLWQNNRTQTLWKIILPGAEKLEKEQAICKNYYEQDADTKKKATDISNEYLSQLKKYRISDAVVSPAYKFDLFNLILVLVGIFLFIPGYLINCLPVLIARNISLKKVYVKEFFAPVLYASATFLLLIWYIILLICGLIWVGWISLVLLISIFMAGYVSILFMEKLNMLLQRNRFKQLSLSTQNHINKLRIQLSNYLPK
ncbi:MAG TPA: 1-acyl-sn-glycerol-3-phosphate acyltransferase [Saprospiraceae bacterium]|nr:1-acyl-sn-glycerol-3-phosphate acyltransferase [Saprospiraceae bacterium]